MKKILLISSALVSLASIGQAQAFNGAVIEGGVYTLLSGGPGTAFYDYNLGGRADFGVGAFGLQLDGYAGGWYYSGSTHATTSQVGVHGYYTMSNGVKVGAYAANETDQFNPFGLSNITSYGAEVLFGTGATTYEISGGSYAGAAASGTYSVAARVSHRINSSFGLTGSYEYITASTGIFTSAGRAKLSVDYTMPSMPITLSMQYSNGSLYTSGPTLNYDKIGINVSYAIGGQDPAKLFTPRGPNLLDGYLAIMSGLKRGA